MPLKSTVTINIEPESAALESNIRQKISKLDQFYQTISRCDVVLEQEIKHQRHGKLYKPRISISVPGEKINVSHAANTDAYVAIRDAFKAVQRRLQRFAKKQRGDVKLHVVPIQGRIARTFDDAGFGFIEAAGEEYFFTDYNLKDYDFSRLRPGMPVEFISDIGSDGLMAKRIHLIRQGKRL